MIKLKIINKNNYDYKLEDEDKRIYDLNINFINIDIKLNINDYIYLKEDMLTPNVYTFGPIYNKEKDDIIKVNSNNNNYYLQRYYG